MATLGHIRVVVAASTFALLLSACSTAAQPVDVQPVPSISAPAPLAADNTISAQASIRGALAASRVYYDKHGDFEGLDVEFLTKKTPVNLTYVDTSDYFSDVSVAYGDTSVAFAAMSPSGACFGAMDDGVQHPSYSHSKIGQASCSAEDVPFPEEGF